MAEPLEDLLLPKMRQMADDLGALRAKLITGSELKAIVDLTTKIRASAEDLDDTAFEQYWNED